MIQSSHFLLEVHLAFAGGEVLVTAVSVPSFGAGIAHQMVTAVSQRTTPTVRGVAVCAGVSSAWATAAAATWDRVGQGAKPRGRRQPYSPSR